MTSLSVDERIEEYRDRLHEDDRDEFDQRFEVERDSLDFDEKREELVSNFEQSENHLELILAAASAFDQDPAAGGHESGYEFAFTEPLAELNEIGEEGVQNGDILLVRQDGDDVYLCIIDCKAGNESERDVLNELENIESVTQEAEYRETLKEQAGIEDCNIRHEQFVILGRPSPMWSLKEDHLEELGFVDNYAVWAYIQGDLSVIHLYGEVQVSSLARVVKDGVDAVQVEHPIKFTYGDHPLTQLKVMAEDIIDEKKKDEAEFPFEFSRSEFSDLFDGHLQVGFEGEVREQLISRKVDYLLELGHKIGLFTDSQTDLNSNRDYRILFRGQKSRVAAQTAEEKYFDVVPELKLREEALNAVRKEFTPAQTRVEDFS